IGVICGIAGGNLKLGLIGFFAGVAFVWLIGLCLILPSSY
ncbi:unnamed protein product, partial [marine sediment metagenome]